MSAKSGRKITRKRKAVETKRRRPIAGVVFFVLAGLIVAFIIVAQFIEIAKCASPCRQDSDSYACYKMKCQRVTLWEAIGETVSNFFSGKKVLPNFTGESVIKIDNYNSELIANPEIIQIGPRVYFHSNYVIHCLKEPCPSPYLEFEIKFSDSGMARVYELINLIHNGRADDSFAVNYNDLDYRNKNVFEAIVSNNEKQMNRFYVVYKDRYGTEYYFTKRDAEVSVVAIANGSNHEIPLELNDEQREAAIAFIDSICCQKGNYSTRIDSVDELTSEQKRAIKTIGL